MPHRNPSSARRPLQRLLALLLLPLLLLGPVSAAQAKEKFKVAWTIYAGWMPWDYAAQSGIVKKWADKYNIEIDVVQINDYVESINQYTAGGFDGCVMTNMDALTIPAAGGIDSTALIVGDFSNGNDGIVLKGKSQLSDIKGQSINLVELSVSHYLLARALEKQGLSEKDIKVVNTSDADMASAFASADVTAAVTWNPILSEITKTPGSHKVFDSSQIPGEIIDLMVVNTERLKAHPELGKALTGAWYEVMSIMNGSDAKAKAARSQMAKASGTDLAGYDSQLAATRLFVKPAEAVAFTQGKELKSTMQLVAEFSFAHGLLGDGAPNAGIVGISTPAGTYGDSNNIKLRFDPSYMQLAADGKL